MVAFVLLRFTSSDNDILGVVVYFVKDGTNSDILDELSLLLNLDIAMVCSFIMAFNCLVYGFIYYYCILYLLF